MAPDVKPNATIEALEYMAARARKTLADPSKSRWHKEEQLLLAQVELELMRLKTQ